MLGRGDVLAEQVLAEQVHGLWLQTHLYLQYPHWSLTDPDVQSSNRRKPSGINLAVFTTTNRFQLPDAS